jgi:hypothetical protein
MIESVCIEEEEEWLLKKKNKNLFINYILK